MPFRRPGRPPGPSRAIAVLAAACFAFGAAPARAADLLAHRAVYDLKLQSSKDGAVTAAAGKMHYEMLDVCDGWATQQRLEMQVTNSEGQDVKMLSEYTTYESKDGLTLRFRMKQTTDEAVTSDIQGDATLQPGGGTGAAHYSLPHDMTKGLPRGTLFPTAHTAMLLAGAEAGKKMLALPLFDGTSEKGAQDSSILVNGWDQTPHDPQFPVLAKLPSGKFHLAFFDHAPEAAEPDYEVSMRYWANGVADDLSMDFGDFVMGGTLAEFTPMPPHGC